MTARHNIVSPNTNKFQELLLITKQHVGKYLMIVIIYQYRPLQDIQRFKKMIAAYYSGFMHVVIIS